MVIILDVGPQVAKIMYCLDVEALFHLCIGRKYNVRHSGRRKQHTKACKKDSLLTSRLIGALCKMAVKELHGVLRAMIVE